MSHRYYFETEKRIAPELFMRALSIKKTERYPGDKDLKYIDNMIEVLESQWEEAKKDNRSEEVIAENILVHLGRYYGENGKFRERN